MTATQSFANHNLSVTFDDDKMEMATSPYPVPDDDDIDFEIDERHEFSTEDNKMIDDTAETTAENPEDNDVMLNDDDDDDDNIDLDRDFLRSNAPQGDAFNDQSVGYAVYEEDRGEDMTLMEEEDDVLEVEHVDDADLQEKITNTDIVTTESFEQHVSQDREHAQDEVVGPTVDGHNLDTNHESDIKDFVREPETEITAAYPAQSRVDEDDTRTEPSIEASEDAHASIEETKNIEELTAKLDHSIEQERETGYVENGEVSDPSAQREATPTNLHPVTIRYNGEDCWLFPPLEVSDSKHVFLDDATLASEPFDRLLAALRTGLINDQEMADHDELVFDIPVLGLHICEDSKHASLMNLSRVIDIYMMLSQNEGLTVFEPLYCELSTRVCLADQFSYVEDAAFVRKISYTDFVGEQAESPEEIVEERHTEVHATEYPTIQENDQAHAGTTVYDNDNAGADGNQEDALALLDETDETNDEQASDVDYHNGEPIELPAPETDLVDQELGSNGEHSVAADAQTGDSLNANSDADHVSVHNEISNTLPSPKEKRPSQDEQSLLDAWAEATIDAKIPPAEAEAETLFETEEDLFADDDDDDVKGKTFIAGTNDEGSKSESNQLQVQESNDQFDFDAWSEDEHENDDTVAIFPSQTTPSSASNGKRKFIEDEDDFLSIDISTPEPKRSRQT